MMYASCRFGEDNYKSYILDLVICLIKNQASFLSIGNYLVMDVLRAYLVGGMGLALSAPGPSHICVVKARNPPLFLGWLLASADQTRQWNLLGHTLWVPILWV